MTRPGGRLYLIAEDYGMIHMHPTRLDVDHFWREAPIAEIWEAWRDGYPEAIAEHTRFTTEEVVAYFEDMIACIRDPAGYAVWHVPVVGAVVPER